MRENRTHGSEGGDGESRFRPLSDFGKVKLLRSKLRGIRPAEVKLCGMDVAQKSVKGCSGASHMSHMDYCYTEMV